MNHRNRRFAACILIGIILVFLDQYTKYLAETFLKPKGYVTVIPGVLELRYLENRGAAFGMLQNRQWIFVVFAICCVILCCWYVFRLAAEDRHLASAVCLSVLAAGASGNLIDRVARGSVIDFIYVSLIHFPVFNVADICVSVSTIVLVFLVLFYYKGDV
jgi:signal peptidase II